MKNVIVTGASGGMGNSICKLLAEKGYQVFGLDLKEPDKAIWPNADTKEPPSNHLGAQHYIPCDITDSASITAAFEQIKTQVTSLDAIIHTAGIYDLDSLIEMDEERFLRIFNINLFGVYRINKTFLPLLQKGGRIIITTSELAPLDPLPFTGIYAVTKGALEKYAYSLRMELNLLGIHVSIIRPGAVKTSLLGDSTRALDKFVDNTALYPCNAANFRKVVDSVEARNIAPKKIARLALKALTVRRPKFVYNINRNILLKLLNILPDRLQVWIIKEILRTR